MTNKNQIPGEIGMVVPVGPGRKENLTDVLNSVFQGVRVPDVTVLVCDGPDAWLQPESEFSHKTVVLNLPAKHEPGMEQPRNLGVRAVEEYQPNATHVWFLDSDCIPAEDALAEFAAARECWRCPECGHTEVGDSPEETTECRACGADNADDTGDTWEMVDRVLVGPYDWLPPNLRRPALDLHNDPRWQSFEEHDEPDVIEGDLSAGLAQFSGNLMWPIEEFKRVGGFWNELHHGRCEDGELGLRAVAMGVPVGFVRGARAWHIWHGGAPAPTPEYIGISQQRNARDVPMLDARHPWLQGSGLFVVEEDGKRFDARCICGWQGNTALIWEHQAECPSAVGFPARLKEE